MNHTILTQKTIKNGSILVDTYYGNSLVFVAKMPKNARVDDVKVNDKFLSGIPFEADATVSFPRGEKIGEDTVIAVVKYNDNPRGHYIYDLAAIQSIGEFDVLFHKEYIDEVE